MSWVRSISCQSSFVEFCLIRIRCAYLDTLDRCERSNSLNHFVSSSFFLQHIVVIVIVFVRPCWRCRPLCHRANVTATKYTHRKNNGNVHVSIFEIAHCLTVWALHTVTILQRIKLERLQFPSSQRPKRIKHGAKRSTQRFFFFAKLTRHERKSYVIWPQAYGH